MSSRTADRQRGVRKAKEQERALVLQGKGTRDWTPEQQASIIEHGIARDEEGRVFEGQHMKSVEAYPEYADDPNNIQFLTRKEHLEAHDGNWKNPTNWYYDPVQKKKIDFGDGPLIPCIIINLSNPIVVEKTNQEFGKKTDKEENQAKDYERSGAKADNYASGENVEITPKLSTGRVRALIGDIRHFFEDHPIAETVVKGVSAVGGLYLTYKSGVAFNKKRKTLTRQKDKESTLNISGIADVIVDTTAPRKRSSPREHIVPAHSQPYHTKQGIIVKEKAPYPRGGNKEEK